MPCSVAWQFYRFLGSLLRDYRSKKGIKDLEVPIQHGQCIDVYKHTYLRKNLHKFHSYIYFYICVFVKQRTVQSDREKRASKRRRPSPRTTLQKHIIHLFLTHIYTYWAGSICPLHTYIHTFWAHVWPMHTHKSSGAHIKPSGPHMYIHTYIYMSFQEPIYIHKPSGHTDIHHTCIQTYTHTHIHTSVLFGEASEAWETREEAQKMGPGREAPGGGVANEFYCELTMESSGTPRGLSGGGWVPTEACRSEEIGPRCVQVNLALQSKVSAGL